MFPGPATTNPPRSPRADAVRNHVRVLEAGAAAFAEYGLDAQMDDVAGRAGVGVGTVYRHFPTKEALLEALLLDRIGEAVAAGRKAALIEDPWEGFTTILRRAAEMQAADRGFAELLAAGLARTDAVQAAMAELHETTATVMRRAQAAGSLRADVALEDVPNLMCGLSRVVGSSDRPAWERYLAIVLDGLRADRATALPPAA